MAITGSSRAAGAGWTAGLAAVALGLSGCGLVSVQAASSSSSGQATPSAAATSSPATSAPAATTPPAVPSTPATTAPRPSPPATSKPSSTPKPAPKPKATAKPTPTPTPTPDPTPTEGDTLHPDDRGAYVLAVQQRLSELGYWLGSPDGHYGYLTSQAVLALQKAAGLGRDGVLGPATRRALRAGVRPSSRIGGTGVEIDKARQLLLVVRGGSVRTILNTSTGNNADYDYEGQKRKATTPSGSFSVFRTVDKLDKGPLGDLWRPRYFNGGIAVHGSGSVPAYPASHGCARVSNPAMNMIWSNGLMPVGSRVVVY